MMFAKAKKYRTQQISQSTYVARVKAIGSRSRFGTWKTTDPITRGLSNTADRHQLSIKMHNAAIKFDYPRHLLSRRRAVKSKAIS